MAFVQLSRKRYYTTLSIIDIGFERLGAILGRISYLNSIGTDGCHQLEIKLRTRDRHIQTPLTTITVNRAEILDHTAIGVFAVADTENDRVSFVTLHTLQALHKERFITLLTEESFEARMLGSAPVDNIFDGPGLRIAICDYTQRPIRVLFEMLEYEVRDLLCLFWIVLLSAPFIYAVRNQHIFDAHICLVVHSRREGCKAAVINLGVRERNQVLVTATIVPLQVSLR